MKKLYFLLLVCFSVSAWAQRLPSTCIPSSLLLRNYEQEVRDLALQRMYAIKSADTALVGIPQKYQDTIMEKLAAVCNLDASIEADSIFRIYCIHNFQTYPKFSIYANLDTSYAWTRAWQAGQMITGYGQLDTFLKAHNVYLESYFTLNSGSCIAVLSTEQIINTNAFMDSIVQFQGIPYAERSQIMMPRAFYYNRTDTGSSKFIFNLGWGDCMMGCICSKRWYYTVYDDCSVAFDSSVYDCDPRYSGRPNKYNCNLFPIEVAQIEAQNMQVNIYPNPANNVLHIAVQTGSYEYTIIDMYGRTVGKGETFGNAAVNINSLAAGMYIVRVRDMKTNATVNNRMVKE